jgi:hypothetical protein
MPTLIGVNTALTAASLTDGKGFGLGDRHTNQDGKEFIYVKASAAISAFDVVTFDETYSTVVAPLSTSNDARGDSVGVAPVAFASGDYGWLQVTGPCTMNVLASCAANVRLNTTATAGSLDDDGTATAMQVQGIYLTAARAASNGSAAGILNRPYIDVTL